MSLGMILLAVMAMLVLFGVGQRVLDKMQLTDRSALIMMAVIFIGGLIPDIQLGKVSVNIGGALAPLGVCVYLLIRTDTKKEVIRALVGSVLTAGAVYLISRMMPEEPEQIVLDPNYVYGLAAGVIAYVLGRSRRAAFICGVLGVMLADTAVALINWSRGINQRLYLGSGGAMDVVVLSGLIAVLLSELVGEVVERLSRPNGEGDRKRVHVPVKEDKQK